MAREPVIVRQEGVLGGRPTFRGTRCQTELLFENLAESYSIDDILDAFPTLDRADLQSALLEAMDVLMERAPQVEARAEIMPAE